MLTLFGISGWAVVAYQNRARWMPWAQKAWAGTKSVYAWLASFKKGSA